MADTERQHRSRLSIAVREAQVILVCLERDRRHGATREPADSSSALDSTTRRDAWHDVTLKTGARSSQTRYGHACNVYQQAGLNDQDRDPVLFLGVQSLGVSMQTAL